MLGSELSNRRPKQNLSDVMQREEDGKTIIYTRHTLIVMNSYSGEIWGMCDGLHTISELIQSIVKKYNVSQDTVVKEVESFLNKLKERNLIIL